MVDRILSSNRCASNCLRADSETGGAKASMLSLECSIVFDCYHEDAGSDVTF